jgi:pimeloyl-ACP methyl ester carboxylesterase
VKLIFIHGAGNTSAVWHYQVKYFPDAEAINLPGRLSQGEPCASVEDYTDWLHRYILQQGYSDPVLIGHSLGGAIAQLYALKYPQDIKALVLIGTGARLRVAPDSLSLMRDGIENPSVWLKNFVEPRYSQVAPEAREGIIKKIADAGPAVQLNDSLCCDKFDIMDRVYQIRVPTLIICGSEDQMTPPKYSSYLASKIEGAKLVIIDGGTHLAFAETPEAVNRAIEQFLNEL